jgi:hypothetical protein
MRLFTLATFASARSGERARRAGTDEMYERLVSPETSRQWLAEELTTGRDQPGPARHRQ